MITEAASAEAATTSYISRHSLLLPNRSSVFAISTFCESVRILGGCQFDMNLNPSVPPMAAASAAMSKVVLRGIFQ